MNARRAKLLLLSLAWMPAACSVVGPPATEAPAPPAPAVEPVRVSSAPQGIFSGYATLTGQRIPASLALSRGGGDSVTAELDLRGMGLHAEGRGAWDGQLLDLELAYGDGCPGTVRIRLRRDAQGRLIGSLNAKDCTGGAEGPLDLAPTR